MKRRIAFFAAHLLTCVPCVAVAACAAASTPIELQRDAQGRLRILLDGKEALVYCYGDEVDLPHYYPVRSPSGKLLTFDDPHTHRSLWFDDTIQLPDQRTVSFYRAVYSRVDPKDPTSPFRNRIRHVKFLAADAAGAQAVVKVKLVWEADLGKTPMLDEIRQMRVVPLGKGEYFLDLRFNVKASYGDVTFVSDAVHYAWPYVRMNPQFSVDKGGTITNSEGGINQEGTHDKPARWVDYSNTIDGVTEGLAVFSAPENEYPHRWLTRDYGTFGPRRVDTKSGTKFVLKKGESLKQHVGILVHSGDVATGRVKQRYQQFIEGKL